MRIVALIPARAGSKRIPGKNTKLLGGKPLIQWTIEAAHKTRVFSGVVVCTDDPAIAGLADTLNFGCRWRTTVADGQPDIEWVRSALEATAYGYDAFAILRPTSPFRTADTISRAAWQFLKAQCSSIRAVERVKQHPGKMWQLNGSEMQPLIANWIHPPHLEEVTRVPWHSQPTQSLPPVYVQNSSLEIAHRWCVDIFGTISGPKVAPFFTEGMEGFSIDYPDDWERAERHVAALHASAPA